MKKTDSPLLSIPSQRINMLKNLLFEGGRANIISPGIAGQLNKLLSTIEIEIKEYGKIERAKGYKEGKEHGNE